MATIENRISELERQSSEKGSDNWFMLLDILGYRRDQELTNDQLRNIEAELRAAIQYQKENEHGNN
jgi:hypothetical protein